MGLRELGDGAGVGGEGWDIVEGLWVDEYIPIYAAFQCGGDGRIGIWRLRLGRDVDRYARSPLVQQRMY